MALINRPFLPIFTEWHSSKFLFFSLFWLPVGCIWLHTETISQISVNCYIRDLKTKILWFEYILNTNLFQTQLPIHPLVITHCVSDTMNHYFPKAIDQPILLKFDLCVNWLKCDTVSLNSRKVHFPRRKNGLRAGFGHDRNVRRNWQL